MQHATLINSAFYLLTKLSQRNGEANPRIRQQQPEASQPAGETKKPPKKEAFCPWSAAE